MAENAQVLGDELIVLSGLTKVYEPTPKWMRPLARSHIRHSVHALDGVDLVVRAGQICAIVGPNGAGKTTMFRIMVGLTTPTGGRGTVHGFDVEHESEQIRQVLGWMPSEDRSLLMRATCKENLALHGRLQGMTKNELAEGIPRILATVGLERQRDAMVASLSAGMKARLRLARAMLPGPRVLLLDEPTGAVDPVAAHALLELIQNLVVEQRLAVLISSHRLEEIEALHSYAVLLDQGRIRYSGDLDDLRGSWDRPQVELDFTDASVAVQAAAALVAAGVETEVDGGAVRCRLAARDGVGELLADLGPLARSVHRIREIPMPLRDLIAQVYANSRRIGTDAR